MATRGTRSRRVFLAEAAGTMVGAVTALSAPAAWARPGRDRKPAEGRRSIMLGEVTVDQFRPPLEHQLPDSRPNSGHDRGRAGRGGRSGICVGSSRRDAPAQPFSLMFKGPMQPRLEQGTYTIEHDAMGETALFLVPVVPDKQDGRPRYQAIFT